VTILVMLWPAISPGLHTFYDRTLGYQAHRNSPFSVWGQVNGLEPLRIAILALVGLGAIGLAFRPRRKTLTQVAAFGAALMIGAQLTTDHWFYLYIVWFYPLLLVAMATLSRAPGSSPARSSPQVPRR
jgi:MFS-type transporter involved in bile tolerance (Atg22 family)